MQDKHEQLGEFGAIPGAPNGPPTDNLSQSRKGSENGKESRTDIPVCPAVGIDVVQPAVGMDATPSSTDKNVCPTSVQNVRPSSEIAQKCSLSTLEIPAPEN
jgi:hypothetical protein